LFERNAEVPNLIFILASSLECAQRLARRESLRDGAVAVELCEGQSLLWRESFEPAT
jgi:hypothetical protein